MVKLWKTFLPSNSSVEFIESCSLPYIKLPDSKLLISDCFIDIFYVLDGMIELMFNIPPSKILSSGDFIFLHGKSTDCFIISGGKDSNVLHARIIPCDLYKDLI
ncbi:TPA: AraC family transcriptional regulator, partial [Salmonella enterica subsp. enterica serovar Bovismorbificans]